MGFQDQGFLFLWVEHCKSLDDDDQGFPFFALENDERLVKYQVPLFFWLEHYKSHEGDDQGSLTLSLEHDKWLDDA